MKNIEKIYIIDINTLPKGMTSDKFAKIWETIDEDMIDDVFPDIVYKVVLKDDLNLEGLGEDDENTSDEG